MVEKITQAFRNGGVEPDDDIIISTDQKKSLYAAIANGLHYPTLNQERKAEYNSLLEFLQNLSNAFHWRKYEKDTVGSSRLGWYCVLLIQWINGSGVDYIITSAIKYKNDTNGSTVRINGKIVPYEHTKAHKNIVIGDTLEAIDKVILFSLSNYFLKFTEAYKNYHKIDSNLINDWYEYVEYGTTNMLTIMLQRNGLTRETAMFIKRHSEQYVIGKETNPKLRRGIRNCGNVGVEQEVADMLLNIPDLFVD